MLFRCLFRILFLLSFVTVRSADGGDASKFYKTIEPPKLKDIPMYYEGQEYRYNGEYVDQYRSAKEIIDLFDDDSKLQNVVKVNGGSESLHNKRVVCCVYVRIGDVDVPYNEVRKIIGFPVNELLNNMCFPSKVVFEDGVIQCKENCLKIIDEDGNEGVINELDIHDYVYNKCTLKREMFHSGTLFDSFLSFKFYECLFRSNRLKPIVSYSIFGIKTEVNGILEPAEIERIIEAVKNGKDVVIFCSDMYYFNLKCYGDLLLDDIGIFDVLFGDEICGSRGVEIYNSLSTVSDLKGCIADLTGINRDDVDIFEDPEGGVLGEKLGEGLELGYGRYVFKLRNKSDIRECKVFFKCEDTEKKLLKYIADKNDIKVYLDFSNFSDTDTMKDRLRQKFAFLRTVDFDVSVDVINDGNEDVFVIQVTIKTYTNDILEQEGVTCMDVSLAVPGLFTLDVHVAPVPVKVTTLEGGFNGVKYCDLIDGVRSIIDLMCGKGAGQKSTYKLLYEGKQVKIVGDVIPIDFFSRSDKFCFYIEIADFKNILTGGINGGKTGKDDKADNGVVGCCKPCKCCG